MTDGFDAERYRAAMERLDGIDYLRKNVPAALAAAGRDGIRRGGTVFDDGLLWPLATLNERALANNVSVLASFCDENNLLLAPHGKTTLSPELFARQMEAGAWGITVANAYQALLCAEFGFRHVFIANEVVDPRGVKLLVDALARNPSFRVVCYVDSLDGVRLLERGCAAAPPARALDVVVELGYPGGRTGCRSESALVQVAQAVHAAPALRLVGVSCYENGQERDAVVAFFDRVRDATERMANLGLFADVDTVIVSAGGSRYFDVVAERLRPELFRSIRCMTLLRSGAYVAHDDGFYQGITPFRRLPGGDRLLPALTIWAEVLSTPEPGLAIAGFGIRDASFDLGNPVPKEHWRDGRRTDVVDLLTVDHLNDQHAFVTWQTDFEMRVGDVLTFGVSHPCTTFDKWPLIPVINDDGTIVDVVHTLF